MADTMCAALTADGGSRASGDGVSRKGETAAARDRRLRFRAGLFKALAHPVRLLLLERLAERPRCVCELAAEIGIEKSVASKHLSRLRAAGLVADERRGTLVEYRLACACVLGMADCVEASAREARGGASADGESRASAPRPTP